MWIVQHAKSEDRLRVKIHEVLHDTAHELGVDPGLVKDGVEAHLQKLLAEHISTLGDGWTLMRREYMTAIGPVDILCKDGAGATVAIEIKRRGDIDGVEQLTRYLELMNRDPHLAPVTGVFAAQQIKPQARTLAEDRGIRCVVLDYDALKGIDDQRAPALLRPRAPVCRWPQPAPSAQPSSADLEPHPSAQPLDRSPARAARPRCSSTAATCSGADRHDDALARGAGRPGPAAPRRRPPRGAAGRPRRRRHRPRHPAPCRPARAPGLRRSAGPCPPRYAAAGRPARQPA